MTTTILADGVFDLATPPCTPLVFEDVGAVEVTTPVDPLDVAIFGVNVELDDGVVIANPVLVPVAGLDAFMARLVADVDVSPDPEARLGLGSPSVGSTTPA